LLDRLFELGFKIIPPSRTIEEQALRYAEVLGQSKAYDAHYLAVTKQLQTELWTADKRLANAANGAGLDWVQWIGDDQASQNPPLSE
jgi:predicted nucleic acid-binding protein